MTIKEDLRQIEIDKEIEKKNEMDKVAATLIGLTIISLMSLGIMFYSLYKLVTHLL